MAWGSPKQLAFFKKMADRYHLCNAPLGKDVFDYEIRMARALRSARAMRDRLRRIRARRGSDAYARKHGFKDFAALEKANWQPYASAAAWTAKRKAAQRRTKPTRVIKKRRGENPFRRHDDFVPMG